MKPKQLLILVAVLAVLGLVAFIAGRTTGGGDKPSSAELRGQDVLEGWDINAVSGIEVADAKGTVTISKPESNIWLVKERKDFPADRAKVENMIRRIWSTPVLQAFEAGSSQDERMELLAPDAEGDDESKATKLTFKGKDGSDIGHLLIGKSKTPTAGPGAAPGSGGKESRFLRTTKDATLVLEVPNGFDGDLSGTGWPYAFGSIESDPGLWLNKEDFIKVQKVATITLDTKEEGKESYSLSRESDTGDFTLSGDIPVGKELDASKVSGLKTILSNASFEDLLTEEEVAKIDETKLSEATLTTFEGFTYKILIGEKDSEKNRIPVKFTVTGELPTERVVEAGKEETEEEKTKADAEFQTKLEENQAKLAQEKALESHWFTLSSFRIDPLLKSRSDLLKDEETAEGEVPSALAKPPGSASTADPQLPPGLNPLQGQNPATNPVVEAVSEPIAVPPLTKGATATTPPIEIPRPPVPPVVEEVKEAVEAATEDVNEAPKAATEAVKDEADAATEAVKDEAKAALESATEAADAAVESATEAANAALEDAAKAAEDKAAGDQ